jgi:uncharacterized membrane protein
VISFAYIAIYWNNHHHLMHAVRRVNGRVLRANVHLLFWLLLVPFTTAWMAENHFAPATVAVYGVSLLTPAIANYVLTRALLADHGPDSTLARALGRDVKCKASLLLYVVAVAMTRVDPRISLAIFVFVALIRIVPDSRIERAIAEESDNARGR